MTPPTHTALRSALRVSLAATAAVASIAALSAPAHAAGTTSVAKSGTMLLVTAASGTANNIALTRSSEQLFFEITDIAGFAIGSGCQSTEPQSARCSASGIGEVRISAGDGDDTVRLNTSTFSRVLGGSGDDTLRSSHFISQARLSGNDGNDQIFGAEFDSLFGQNGNDSLSGGQFQNGGAGTDQLNGSNDNDTLDGGTGFDRIDGRGGSDLCVNGEVTQNCEQ